MFLRYSYSSSQLHGQFLQGDSSSLDKIALLAIQVLGLLALRWSLVIESPKQVDFYFSSLPLTTSISSQSLSSQDLASYASEVRTRLLDRIISALEKEPPQHNQRPINSAWNRRAIEADTGDRSIIRTPTRSRRLPETIHMTNQRSDPHANALIISDGMETFLRRGLRLARSMDKHVLPLGASAKPPSASGEEGGHQFHYGLTDNLTSAMFCTTVFRSLLLTDSSIFVGALIELVANPSLFAAATSVKQATLACDVTPRAPFAACPLTPGPTRTACPRLGIDSAWTAARPAKKTNAFSFNQVSNLRKTLSQFTQYYLSCLMESNNFEVYMRKVFSLDSEPFASAAHFAFIRLVFSLLMVQQVKTYAMHKIHRMQSLNAVNLSQLLNAVTASFAWSQVLATQFFHYLGSNAQTEPPQLFHQSTDSCRHSPKRWQQRILRNLSVDQPLWRLVIHLDEVTVHSLILCSYWKRIHMHSHCPPGCLCDESLVNSFDSSSHNESIKLIEEVLSAVWRWRRRNKASRLCRATARSLCSAISLLVEGLCLNVEGSMRKSREENLITRGLSQERSCSNNVSSVRLLEILSYFNDQLKGKTSEDHSVLMNQLQNAIVLSRNCSVEGFTAIGLHCRLYDAENTNKTVLLWVRRLIFLLVDDVFFSCVDDRDRIPTVTSNLLLLEQESSNGCKEYEEVLGALLEFLDNTEKVEKAAALPGENLEHLP